MTEQKNNRNKLIGLSALALLSIGACSVYTMNQPQKPTEEVAVETTTTTEKTTQAVADKENKNKVVPKEETKKEETTQTNNELDKVVEISLRDVGEKPVETEILNTVESC